MNVKIVTHYGLNDPEYMSDYSSIDVWVDGKLVVEYGDSYHEKGKERVAGFVDALQFMVGKKAVKLSYDRIADGDY